MKKSKKVYGVYNIVEWHANIKVGKATIRVHFSGGAMTTQGVTPATFTTTDPIVQLSIEHSEPYRSGKIKLLKTFPTKEDIVVERNTPCPTDMQEVPTESSPKSATTAHADIVTTDIPNTPCPTDMQEVPTESSPKSATTAHADIVTTDIPKNDADECIESQLSKQDPKPTTTVRVTCDRDAAEYLREKFGIAISKLHSKTAIKAAAKQHGITFQYIYNGDASAIES